MKELTPTARQLYDRISDIIAKSKGKKPGEGFIVSDLQNALQGMTASDMIALSPPSAEVGVWTADNGFNLRLACRLFGVSPESVQELPWQHYFVLTQIVSANFLRSMEEVMPS